MLYKLRNLVPKQSLKSFYSSSVLKKIILEPLKRTLRKAARVIDSANYTAHSEPVFKGLKILNFDNLFMLEKAKMIFQIDHDTSKFFLENEFVKTKHMHKYSKRQSSSEGFPLPSISTNFKKAFLWY